MSSKESWRVHKITYENYIPSSLSENSKHINIFILSEIPISEHSANMFSASPKRWQKPKKNAPRIIKTKQKNSNKTQKIQVLLINGTNILGCISFQLRIKLLSCVCLDIRPSLKASRTSSNSRNCEICYGMWMTSGSVAWHRGLLLKTMRGKTSPSERLSAGQMVFQGHFCNN
jgi:hypothetical protein